MSQFPPTLSPHPLFPFSKLISSSNGTLLVNQDNLDKIISHNNSKVGDLPITFISITGPPLIGKTFCTNLLIHYYNEPRRGGWLLNLLKKEQHSEQRRMPGFNWNGVEPYDNLLVSNEEAAKTSGIYIWPEPFLTETSKRDKMALWILHICQKADATADDLQCLERFLLLACSRIAEINSKFEFQMLWDMAYFKACQEESMEAADMYSPPSSIVYIFRTNDKIKSGVSDDEVKYALKELIQSSNSGLDETVVNSLEHVNMIKIKEINEDLHNNEGFLSPAFSKNYKCFQNAIIKIVGADELKPKQIQGGELLRMSGLSSFLEFCAATVNELRKESESHSTLDLFKRRATRAKPRQTKEIEDNPLDQVINQKLPKSELERSKEEEEESPITTDPKVLNKLIQDNNADTKATFPSLNITGGENEASDEDQSALEIIPQVNQLQVSSNCAKAEEPHSQAQIDMLQLVKQVEMLILPELYEQLKKWILHPLSPRNITEVNAIGSHVLQQFISEWHANLVQSFWTQFDAECQRIYEEKCSPVLKTLEDVLVAFANLVEREKLDKNINSLETLGNLCNSCERQLFLAVPTHPEIHEIAKLGCASLTKYFLEFDKTIQAIQTSHTNHELNITEEVEKKMVSRYNLEMKRHLEISCFEPNILMKIHIHLIELFQNSYSQLDVEYNLNEKEKSIKALFGKEFQNHLRVNNEKLNLVKKPSAFFTDKANSVASKNAIDFPRSGLDPPSIQSTNYNRVGLIKKELPNDMKVNPPTKESLTASVSNNNVKIQPVRKNSIEVRKELEVESLPRKMNEKGLANLDSKQYKQTQEPKHPLTSESTTISKKTLVPPQLSPLVFYIQSEQVRMGMLLNGKVGQIENEQNALATPLIVGLDKSNELVYGDVAVEKQKRNRLQKSWSVAKHLISKDKPFNEAVKIRGKIHVITVQFLLAFILRKLKQNTERIQNGIISDALLTVPFWFCSRQRLQVQEGAELAGFKSIHLVSEPCAAAYSAAFSMAKREEKGNIIVLSEHSENVDATVFNCNKGNVIFLGHSGSYCMGEYTQSNKYFFRKWVEQNEKEKVRSPKETVQFVCGEALAISQDKSMNTTGNVSKPNEFIVTFDNEAWGKLMNQTRKELVGRKAASMQTSRLDNALIILQGATLLSRKLNKIGEVVRDMLAFSLIFSSDGKTDAVIRNHMYLLPTTSQKFSQKLPRKAANANFCQNKVSLGKLQLLNVPTEGHIEVEFEINFEGIVKTPPKVFHNRGIYLEKIELRKDAFRWHSPTLNCNDLEKTNIISLLEEIIGE